tara:strand:+ start:356 stop:529 length:174 start_codon:yes stop_codon:yes gene_type:complete
MSMRKYSSSEIDNLKFGQAGSIFIDGTNASSPPSGNVFVAITFLANSTFDSSNGLSC